MGDIQSLGNGSSHSCHQAANVVECLSSAVVNQLNHYSEFGVDRFGVTTSIDVFVAVLERFMHEKFSNKVYNISDSDLSSLVAFRSKILSDCSVESALEEGLRQLYRFLFQLLISNPNSLRSLI